MPEHRGGVLRLDDFVGGYVDMVGYVMENGRESAPRGAITKEVLGVTLVIPGDAPMLPVGTGRGVNVRLAAEEALQTIGGYSNPDPLFRVNPGLRAFADQGAFHGAYGPRIRSQMETVYRRLRDDPETRRAVVSIWDADRDRVEGVKNYPCTTELQFMLRWMDELEAPPAMGLDLHVTMRANDAWHGLAYDAFVFNQLQRSLARSLAVPLGTYYHHDTSLHVYQEHWELTGGLKQPEDEPSQILAAHGIGRGPDTFENTAARARTIGDGGLLRDETESERWYADRHFEIMDRRSPA